MVASVGAGRDGEQILILTFVAIVVGGLPRADPPRRDLVVRAVRLLGQSTLIVDKHLDTLATLCDRAVVIERGRAV